MLSGQWGTTVSHCRLAVNAYFEICMLSVKIIVIVISYAGLLKITATLYFAVPYCHNRLVIFRNALKTLYSLRDGAGEYGIGV